MTRFAGSVVFPLAIFLLAASSGAFGQEPEKVEVPAVQGNFTVLTTYGDGTPGEVFNSSRPLVLDINFVLALSPTGTYPLTLTLIQESGATREELEIWKGTLEDGFYRLKYPVALPVGFGEVAVKLIMKVRMFKERYSQESSYQYTTWEGSYRVGKR
jgi:hypothetical protein